MRNDTLSRDILGKIDGAVPMSKDTFKSRNRSAGEFNKAFLSTGSKTLLNILNHSNICFNVAECGYNVLNYLPQFSIKIDGNILWEHCYFPFSMNYDCDILYHGKRYSKACDFSQDAYNEGEDKDDELLNEL